MIWQLKTNTCFDIPLSKLTKISIVSHEIIALTFWRRNSWLTYTRRQFWRKRNFAAYENMPVSKFDNLSPNEDITKTIALVLLECSQVQLPSTPSTTVVGMSSQTALN